jgi:hypothetical protein
MIDRHVSQKEGKVALHQQLQSIQTNIGSSMDIIKKCIKEVKNKK